MKAPKVWTTTICDQDELFGARPDGDIIIAIREGRVEYVYGMDGGYADCFWGFDPEKEGIGVRILARFAPCLEMVEEVLDEIPLYQAVQVLALITGGRYAYWNWAARRFLNKVGWSIDGEDDPFESSCVAHHPIGVGVDLRVLPVGLHICGSDLDGTKLAALVSIRGGEVKVEVREIADLEIVALVDPHDGDEDPDLPDVSALDGIAW